jgi:hyperosmotically inducible periplasmic protein
MNRRQLSMVAMTAAGLLAATGCAHGNRADAHTTASDRDGRKVARNDAEHDEPRTVRDEQTGERVEVPRRGDKGDRIASADGVPARDKAETSSEQPASAAEMGTSADNTRVNERDRESSALTPMDQGGSQSDRDLTQSIRKGVIADDSLSFSAKNVKIITRDGRVTLRGTVNNAREKATIERTATDLAGPKRVTNELEISE